MKELTYSTNETKAENNRMLYSFLAFVLGLCPFENISSIFVIGNTRFVFSVVYSAFLFVFLFATNPSKLIKSIKTIPKPFIFFGVICVFTIIPGFLYFGTAEIFVRFFVGLISLVLSIFALVDVIFLSNYKKQMICGLFLGLILNTLISLYSYFSFKSGTIFTLKTFFPDDLWFYVPMYGAFRTQGFFLEPSHFVRYFITSYFIVFWYFLSKKNKRGKLLFLLYSIASIPVLLISGSGNVVIAIIVLLSLLFLYKGKLKHLIIFIVCIAVIGLFVYSYFNPALFNRYFNNIVSGGNITDESNVYRFSSMKLYFSYVIESPFGIGYNLTGTLRTKEGLVSSSAFSELVEIFLETGFLGIAVYLYSIVWIIVSLFKNRNNYSMSLLATIIGIIILQAGTDYSPDVSYMIVIGLSIACLPNKNTEKRPCFNIFYSVNKESNHVSCI